MFRNKKALQAHRLKEQGGQHGKVTYAQLVVTNQCVYCNRLFKNTQTAKAHVTTATEAGKCKEGVVQASARKQIDGVIKCKLCGEDFEGEEKIDEYHEHLRSEHLETPEERRERKG